MGIRKVDAEYIQYYGDNHEEYVFECPGCKDEHRIIVRWGDKSGRNSPQWSFNGDMGRPTFNPSLLVTYSRGDMPSLVCHSFIRDGNIQFLGDCTHELRDKTVPL